MSNLDINRMALQSMGSRIVVEHRQHTRLFMGTHHDFAKNYLGCSDQQIEEMGLNIKKDYFEGAARTVTIGSSGVCNSDELALSDDHFDNLT